MQSRMTYQSKNLKKRSAITNLIFSILNLRRQKLEISPTLSLSSTKMPSETPLQMQQTSARENPGMIILESRFQQLAEQLYFPQLLDRRTTSPPSMYKIPTSFRYNVEHVMWMRRRTWFTVHGISMLIPLHWKRHFWGDHSWWAREWIVMWNRIIRNSETEEPSGGRLSQIAARA